MPKIVHKQKNPFGGDVYLDENYRVVGYSQKGLFGEEVILDKDLKVAGRKQKGVFGEDVWLDRDYHVRGYGHKALGDTRVYTDQDGHYAGWGGDGFAVFDRNRENRPAAEERRARNIALVIMVIVMAAVAFVMVKCF